MKDVLELMEKQGLKPGQLTIGDCIGLAQAADLKVSDIVVAEAMAVNQMTREEVMSAVLASFAQLLALARRHYLFVNSIVHFAGRTGAI